MNLYRTGAFRNKKLSHHALPRTYIHNIRHFTLLLCWTHVIDWSTVDAGGAARWVRQETVPGSTFKKNRHYFRTDLHIPLYHLVIFLGVTRNQFYPVKWERERESKMFPVMLYVLKRSIVCIYIYCFNSRDCHAFKLCGQCWEGIFLGSTCA